ncbi:uncharacterized protein [Dysidea avara]|uniref:uncharacterized protein n=1 Tax=Dysidea avara TaxID=196820 RepID=UPI00332C321A
MGLFGFENRGNICFLISVLQCLIRIPKFLHFWTHSAGTDRNCIVASELRKLCSQVERSDEFISRPVYPTAIVNYLPNIIHNWRYGMQYDAHEMLLGILNSKSAFAAGIEKLIQFEMFREVTCSKCQISSQAVSKYNHLDVPVYSHQVFNSTLPKVIVEELDKTEQLDGPNKYNCSRCKTSCIADIHYCAKTLPDILIVHIKRFESRRSKVKKICTSMPIVSSLCIIYNQETEHSYDLKAVVSHIGTEAASGHYVTCVDTFAGWSIFDDSNVRYVSEADVLKQQGYILFYQKKDNSALTLTQENANICGSQGSQPDAINTELVNKNQVGHGKKSNSKDCAFAPQTVVGEATKQQLKISTKDASNKAWVYDDTCNSKGIDANNAPFAVRQATKAKQQLKLNTKKTNSNTKKTNSTAWKRVNQGDLAKHNASAPQFVVGQVTKKLNTFDPSSTTKSQVGQGGKPNKKGTTDTSQFVVDQAIKQQPKLSTKTTNNTTQSQVGIGDKTNSKDATIAPQLNISQAAKQQLKFNTTVTDASSTAKVHVRSEGVEIINDITHSVSENQELTPGEEKVLPSRYCSITTDYNTELLKLSFILLEAVLSHSEDKFVTSAKDIKHCIRTIYGPEENGSAVDGGSTTTINKEFADKFHIHLDEKCTEVVFQESKMNKKKSFILNRTHLQCLNPCSSGVSSWLNDHVINAYTILIAQSFKNVYPMNSQVVANFPSICWKQDKLFAFDYWIAPIHLHNHWAMLVVDFLKKTFHYSDSVDCASGYKPICRMMSFMEAKCALEKRLTIGWKDWRIQLHYEFPRQQNATDCGIFALKAAVSIISQSPGQMKFMQEGICQVRYKI